MVRSCGSTSVVVRRGRGRWQPCYSWTLRRGALRLGRCGREAVTVTTVKSMARYGAAGVRTSSSRRGWGASNAAEIFRYLPASHRREWTLHPAFASSRKPAATSIACGCAPERRPEHDHHRHWPRQLWQERHINRRRPTRRPGFPSSPSSPFYPCIHEVPARLRHVRVAGRRLTQPGCGCSSGSLPAGAVPFRVGDAPPSQRMP